MTSDEELIDSFFTIKTNARKIKQTPIRLSLVSTTHPTTTSSTHSRSNNQPSPSFTPPRLLSIPRRPKEKARSTPLSSRLQTPLKTSHETPSRHQTRDPNPSPINTSTAHSASPPPLPPPLDFPQIHSKTSVTLTPARPSPPRPVVIHSNRSFSNSKSSINQRAKSTGQLSPYIAPPDPDFDQILVPDSTDSPPNSPHRSSHLQNHRHISDFESDIELEECCDPVPKLLFNPSSPAPSNHSPSKRCGSYSNEIQSLNNSAIQKNASNLLEEEKRQQLLLELGFDEQPTAPINDPISPLSSSPIEIIQSTRSKELELIRNGKKKQTPSSRVECLNKTNNGLDTTCEWIDDQSGAQPTACSSSHKTSSKRVDNHHHLFATPQDQIRHIGVIVDDSDEEEGNSGIAPLMNSWPASKRTIFMKMAGLKAKGIGDDEIESTEDQAKEVAEWDRLLNNRRKTNNTTTTNDTFPSNKRTKSSKKSWNNRTYFRRKKSSTSASSKSFKSFPKSSFKKSK